MRGRPAWVGWLMGGGVTARAVLAGLVLLGGASYFSALLVLGFRPRDYMRRVNR